MLSFIQQLAQTALPPDLHNPYTTSAARRHNLLAYLEWMQAKRPFALLVGEAPGYRGCRLTGIPFSSPALLSQPPFTDLDTVTPCEWPDIQHEASATIVWQLLNQLPTPPLLWNACPFHPWQPPTARSNRTPRISELDWGRPFLSQLLTRFPITTVIAVGNRADLALTRWHIPHHKVRHPSHGGKRPFIEQTSRLLGLRPA